MLGASSVNPAAAEQLDDRAALAVPDFPRQGKLFA